MARIADDVELELANVRRAYDAAMRERPRDEAKVDRLAVRMNRLREELREAERRHR